MHDRRSEDLEKPSSHEAQLTSQRHRFSLPEGSHYLNCAYMAPLAKSVEEAALSGLRQRRQPSRIRPEDFFEPSQRVREKFAGILGAKSTSVALLPSVSYGMAIVARNLHLEPGQEIVVCGEQFPSNIYPWARLAERSGGRLHTVPAPAPGPGRALEWNRRLLAAIGHTTALVAVPQVHWSDGTLFDLSAIGERARQVGAALVLDTTQSAGALQLDLPSVGPDAVIAAAYKTLFGPYGSAFGWFGERFIDGDPLEETWIARAGSEDFSRLVDYSPSYRPGAERFDVGQRSQPILIPMLDAALDLVSQWGPSRIQNYADGLWQSVLPDLENLGCWVEEAQHRCQHLVGLFPPAGTDLEKLRQELASRQVQVSIRGTAVRVAVQAFNEPADLEALVEALRTVL